MSDPAPSSPAPKPTGPFAGITRNVVVLGFVSFFTDVSTEMIVPVLPLFVTRVLGASVTSLGIIEGIAEATAALLRIASGWISDVTGKRKALLAGGYGLSGVAKALLALAASWPAVLFLRFADRFGKGVRNPPRDSLLADSTEPATRGRAFGFHRGLDTLGAAVGPLVAWVLLAGQPTGLEDFRRIFAISAIPAALCLVTLVVFLREPPRQHGGGGTAPPAFVPAGAFRRFLVVDGVFQLGNSSMAFALLRASRLGLSPGQVTLVYFGYNMVYALLSYPLGGLSDRIGRRPLLLAAYLLYAGVYTLFALGNQPILWVAAFLLYGLHSALLEGQQKTLIADLVPSTQRGTAYGVYYAVVGAALLPASVIAGLLWDRLGPAATFGAGALFSALAAALLFTWLPASGERADRHAHAR